MTFVAESVWTGNGWRLIVKGKKAPNPPGGWRMAPTESTRDVHAWRADMEAETMHTVATRVAPMVRLVLLPDGVTSARNRWNAAESVAARAIEPGVTGWSLRSVLTDHWCCRWTLRVAGHEPFTVNVTPKQRKVLEVLEPGRQISLHDMTAAGGYRFGARIHELRQMGFPIDTIKHGNGKHPSYRRGTHPL